MFNKLILDYDLKELKQDFKQIGVKEFRASQILNYAYSYVDFNQILNIPKNEIDAIMQNYNMFAFSKVITETSIDGTVKFGFVLNDNRVVEAVLMSYKYGSTVCVSTQVGCRMGCKFCASTIGGLVRNLSVGEMLCEIIYINKFLGGDIKNRKVTNVVLMGCGEPLDNYDNVTKFIKELSNPTFLNISERNISLSTCGIVPNIKRLADDGFKLNLTISLHASNDEDRKKIMPIAYKYSISEILDATRYYFDKTKRRVYYEYTLCKDVNDKEQNIKELVSLLKGQVCHINIINLNKVKELNTLEAVDSSNAYKFCEKLTNCGLSATVRRTLGEDINGACGQLRKKIMDDIGE